jgi:hypothetical protein
MRLNSRGRAPSFTETLDLACAGSVEGGKVRVAEEDADSGDDYGIMVNDDPSCSSDNILK